MKEPATSNIDKEGYKRMTKRWDRLVFGEALREVLEYYGWEQVEKDPTIHTLTYRRKRNDR